MVDIGESFDRGTFAGWLEETSTALLREFYSLRVDLQQYQQRISPPMLIPLALSALRRKGVARLENDTLETAICSCCDRGEGNFVLWEQTSRGCYR